MIFRTKQLFCLTGLPLSGKSHMARILADSVQNSLHISTGDIARNLIKSPEQQKEMEKKDLFPGETQLRTELKRQIDDATSMCIFVDGFPRFGDQAKYLVDNFYDLSPIVIDVNAGDISTLSARARVRARDARDSNPVEFMQRLALAMRNHNEVSTVLQQRMVPVYTIFSTGDNASILNQFKQITRKIK
jgi:adenylate kinase family enzyme